MTILPNNFNSLLTANISDFFGGISSFVIILIAIPFVFWIIEYMIGLLTHRAEERALMKGLSEEQIAEEQVELKQIAKLEKHFESDLGI